MALESAIDKRSSPLQIMSRSGQLIRVCKRPGSQYIGTSTRTRPPTHHLSIIPDECQLENGIMTALLGDGSQSPDALGMAVRGRLVDGSAAVGIGRRHVGSELPQPHDAIDMACPGCEVHSAVAGRVCELHVSAAGFEQVQARHLVLGGRHMGRLPASSVGSVHVGPRRDEPPGSTAMQFAAAM
eukprot:1322737-Rhodomonas_salina.2